MDTSESSNLESEEMTRLRAVVNSMDNTQYRWWESPGGIVAPHIERLQVHTRYLGEYVVHLLDRIEQLERRLDEK